MQPARVKGFGPTYLCGGSWQDEQLAHRYWRAGVGRQPVHAVRRYAQGKQAELCQGGATGRSPPPIPSFLRSGRRNDVNVARAKLAAQIALELVNDGPVTICLDSREISVVVWGTRDCRHMTLHRNHSFRGCLARHQVDLDERLAR